MKFSDDLRSARLQAIIDGIDSGSANGYVELFTSSSVLLGTIVLANPCGVVGTGAQIGTMTFAPSSPDLSVDADGTLDHAKVYNSAGVHQLTATCGVAGSGADIIFNTTTFLTGGSASLLSWSLIEGNQNV